MSSDFTIPEPCHESWGDMTPAERGRHCAVCDKVVVDLTSMPAKTGKELVNQARSAGQSVCARTRVDARKRIVFGPIRRHVLSNGLALLLAFGAAGCGGDAKVAVTGEPVTSSAANGEEPVTVTVPIEHAGTELGEVDVIMGDLCVPDELPPEAGPKPDEAPVPDDEPVIMGEICPPDHEPAPVDPEKVTTLPKPDLPMVMGMLVPPTDLAE